MFDTKVVKMDGEFKDRLYLVNNLLVSPPKGFARCLEQPLRAVRSNGASTRRTPLLTRPAPYAGT